ncbi:unnamed protein product, partial [Mycena citricolor]
CSDQEVNHAIWLGSFGGGQVLFDLRYLLHNNPSWSRTIEEDTESCPC